MSGKEGERMKGRATLSERLQLFSNMGELIHDPKIHSYEEEHLLLWGKAWWL